MSVLVLPPHVRRGFLRVTEALRWLNKPKVTAGLPVLSDYCPLRYSYYVYYLPSLEETGGVPGRRALKIIRLNTQPYDAPRATSACVQRA